MLTKLSRFCDGLIEAIWFCAFIVIPLFFNTLSSRIFEPDKISVLRTITLIALAAWITKVVDLQATKGWPDFSWSRLRSQLKTFLQIPLVLPVLCLAIIYIVATAFSVTPATSFWGSYQRLQGTYTTFSYLILFIIVLGNLRRKEQLERLLSIAILTSLPISLYGIIQRYGFDPIPWAGNVTNRITGNMGNSIFIAAFLIMVFPLTAMRIIQSLTKILREQEKLSLNIILCICYVFIAFIQLTAIYFSGSRGPWLGLGLGVMIFWFGLSLIWQKRWLAISGIVLVGVLSIFIILLNIPGGTFDDIKDISGISRLGQLLDAESRTGRVRTLIWQGASELVLPHEPLQYPDGSEDNVNFFRPWIGYGPESMFVAFNRFYPPGLTEVEKRNASPDRSHNETWDSLIFTGFLGLVSLYFLFGSVIFYSLGWLGFLQNHRQKKIFILSVITGGVIGACLVYFWKGLHYIGVGLPFGMILSVFLFLAIRAIFINNDQNLPAEVQSRNILLLAIFSAIMAHFMELIFGIGIAATRTYFWMYSGILVFVGTKLLELPDLSTDRDHYGDQVSSNSQELTNQNQTKGRNRKIHPGSLKNKKATSIEKGVISSWLANGITGGLIISVVLITLGYDFVSVQARQVTTYSIFISSILPRSLDSAGTNYYLVFLLISSWIIFGIILSIEFYLLTNKQGVLASFGVMLSLSAFLFFIYIFWHSSNLAMITKFDPGNLDDVIRQVKGYESLYLKYVVALILLCCGIAFALARNWPSKFASFVGVFLGSALVAIVFISSLLANQRIIQADIAFKAADSFTRPGYWPIAISIYDRALSLSPSEDYYYLYLARAYLEQAKSMEDNQARIKLIEQAEKDIIRARNINPLNTDHTANLARLNSAWAEFSEDPDQKLMHAQKSSDYYEMSVSLSPNNARLWGEWAFLLFSQLSENDKADEKIIHALEIDPNYEWLHSLQGEFYYKKAEMLPDEDPAKQALYLQALDSYKKGLSLVSATDTATRYRSLLSIARTYSRLDRFKESIQYYQDALSVNPNSIDAWRIYEVISRLFLEIQDRENSLLNALKSKENAPENQQSRLDEFIQSIKASP